MEFRVDNDTKYFIFDPKVEGESDFFLAKKGDSIVKPAFADYLLLKKRNKTYSITFERP